MKKFYPLLLFIFFYGYTKAQPYGNEWIPFGPAADYSLQQYFKISVWKEGIYRITYNDLAGVNFPIASVNPKKMQLFRDGKEQYIFVSKDTAGWDNTMYIEFYGRRNDGSFDSQMYDTDTSQVNKNLSLFNDTAAYFLTWDNFGADGKRMIPETDMNFAAYPLATYVMRNAYTDFGPSFYNPGFQDGYGLTDNSYISGETWSSPKFSNPPNPLPVSLTVNIPTPNISSLGPLAELETAVLGVNNSAGVPNHLFTLTLNNAQLVSDYFNGYEWRKYKFNLNASGLTAGTTSFTALALSTGGGPNTLSVPYINLKYPHSMSFLGEPGAQKFYLEGGNIFGKAHLVFSNVNIGSGNPFLYAISGDTIRKVSVAQTGSLEMLVPNGAEQHCYLVADGDFFSLTAGDCRMQPVVTDPNPNLFARFINYKRFTGDYIMITHASLMNEAISYKSYRESAMGGARQVILADVQQLYDQFSFGINGHPQSIRNFCKYLIDFQPVKPKDLFLVGKAISFLGHRSHNYALDLVPTYGYPPSDNLFTAGLTDSATFKIAISTGRLAARAPGDVAIYQSKVEEYESATKDEWMKKVLHFCGGSTQSENDLLCGYLDEYKHIIEDTLFGAKVFTFSKSSSAPISNISSLELKDLINNGVSFMTFFAHAAGSSFDISTDAPSTYQNKGKYPIVIANSCYIGDIHSLAVLASEEFVILQDKGAIAFIAAPNEGFESFLYIYSRNLYHNISNLNYGNSIASSMKKTIDTVLTMNPGNFYFKSTCLGMTLHGDPAIIPNSFSKPDLFIDNPSLFTFPGIVTSEDDTFQLKVVVRNLGRATNTPFLAQVSRVYPDGTDTVITISMPYVTNTDTVTVSFRTAPEHGSGPNHLHVRLDINDVVKESNEGNNDADLIINIQSSDLNPVYPYKYAIIPDNTVTLKATTSDPFAPLRTYRFEIDDNDDFVTPILTHDISQTGGVVSYTLPFVLDSNKVYYWRVADADIINNPQNHNWKESSFIYKPGKTGWSQADFYQFKNDERINVIYNRPVKTFDFISTQSTLLVRNSLEPWLGSNHPLEYLLDNILKDYGIFDYAHPCIHVVVLDSLTLEPWGTRSWKVDPNTGDTTWTNKNHYFHNLNDNRYYGHNRDDYYFAFHTDSLSMEYIKDMVSQVPSGNYLVFFSVLGNMNSTWPPDVKTMFNNLGADSINFIQDWQPWIYFCKKGSPSTSQEVVGDSVNTTITLTALLGGNWSAGYMRSELIGPATKWTGLHWAQHSMENPNLSKDSMLLKLIGIDKNGGAVEVIPQILKNTTDINNLDSIVDAKVYPYLKFEIYLQDDSLKTPPQVDRWQIYYDEVPEAAINPSKLFSFYKNPLDEGDTARLTVALENISNTDFTDSMLVDYYLYDQSHQRVNLGSPRYRKLKAGETDTLSVLFGTVGRRNTNSLWVEANPHLDQAEQYHYNNFAQINFEVNSDITNPILDVTFDGIHILNGDIISSKPFVVMQLRDENKFLALNDTSHWRVFLKDPDGVSRLLFFEPVPGYSGDPSKMKWTPAQLPKNSFKIEYNPELLKDGVYELNVNASSDESGNESGKNSYKITFEIINHSTITSVMNYPNPFSTSTRFVFTLTGSEIPDYFKIQIMTVTGKIVREIMRDELGNIHIGRNITDYAWNGKDEYGDQLANGIYLYRVITSINGNGIEKRSTDADKFFTKGYGKKYLMR
jgi:hypothetical protein